MADLKNIPPAIAKTLQASLHRIRRIVLFRGICQTLAVFIASVLAIMAIDAMVTIYSNWVRWLLWLGAMAGTGAVAWAALVKPLRRKISMSDVALLIERNHPELEERLSTVVELAEEGDTEVWSKELVDEITKCAVTDIGKVTPKKEFTSRTIKPRLIAAAAAVFVIVALFAAFPTATSRLVARALLPSAEVDNIYASSLKVAPGDSNVVLRVGDSFKVSLAVDGGFPSRAFVRTSVDGEDEAVERMVRLSAEEDKGPIFYEFNYPSVSKSFSYRVNCGSALTKAYSVKVVPTPTFLNRKIRIEHPGYTGRDPTEYTNAAQVVAVNGSKVVISVDKPREDITGYVTLAGGRTVEGVEDDFEEGKLTFTFDVTPELDGMWSSTAMDSNGFSNQVDNATVTVAKDTPPLVELTVPTETEVKLPRTGIMPVEFRAKDDFQVAKAVLEIAVGAGEYQDLAPIAFAQAPDGWVMGTDNVLIQSLKSKLGDAAAAQFRVRVEDNLPAELGGPGVAYSPSVLVEIVTHGQKGDKSLAEQSLEKQIDETKKEAADIRKILLSAQNAMKGARDCYSQPKNGWMAQEAKNRHGRAKSEISNAETLFAQFIQDLKDTRLSTGAAILQPVMDKHLIPVREEIEDLYLVDPADRHKPSVKVCEDFQKLMEAYDAALKKYEILTKKAEDMQKMEDMKEKQEALAEAAKEDSMSAKEMSEAQQKLMDEMSELMSEDFMNRNLDKQIKQAEELAKKAEELAQRQKDIKENKSGDEQRKGEDQLAKELGKLAQEAQKLAMDVSQQTGTSEMDEDKTAEPLENAQSKAEEAQESAEDASDNLADNKPEDAKADMDDVAKALEDVKKELEDSIDRMKKANERFQQEQKQMDEMMEKMNKAMEEAMEAAKSELGEMEMPQMSQEQMDQMSQAMQEAMENMPQMTEEQMKQMMDAMKEAMEQMKAMSAEMMKQMLEAMKAALGSMDPEAMKQAMKDAMEQMKNQMGQMQKADMASAMEEAAMEMGKMEMGQMQQMSMEPQSFKPQSPQMQSMQMQMPQMPQMQGPQMPQQQQPNMPQQQQQNAQQMSQMSQQQQGAPDPSQSKWEKSSGPMSNSKEALGEDSGVDWFRMKSSSSSGAEADPMNDVPAEYRNLVKDYFKALNAGDRK